MCHAELSTTLDRIAQTVLVLSGIALAILSGMAKHHETILNEQAWIRVGGLSQPSKMPCYSYSIPATLCKLGSLLRPVAGSTCSKCYALKGMYVFANVKAAMQRRYEALTSPTWVQDMVRVIAWKQSKVKYFRWHDSGDIQSLEHLENIVEIAKRLPEIKFWLPTREYAVVKAFIEKHGAFPINLTVRLSATKIDSAAPSTLGLPTSTVTTGKPTCKAYKQNGECKSCRACWSKDVSNVSYPKH